MNSFCPNTNVPCEWSFLLVLGPGSHDKAVSFSQGRAVVCASDSWEQLITRTAKIPKEKKRRGVGVKRNHRRLPASWGGGNEKPKPTDSPAFRPARVRSGEDMVQRMVVCVVVGSQGMPLCDGDSTTG